MLALSFIFHAMMSEPNLNVFVVVMGVCGVGKSAVASRLANSLGANFIDADDFHTDDAKKAMAEGIGLDDAYRLPWLDRVAHAALEAKIPTVIACSALKRIYRDQLRSHQKNTVFVHLVGDRALIAERLANREGHFVGTPLLDSQLETLEPLHPEETGFEVDISYALPEVCSTAQQKVLHGEFGKAFSGQLASG
jgi:gluconokinase